LNQPAFEGEMATLKSELAAVTSERDIEREQVIALRISIAGLEATCKALWEPWWRRLRRRRTPT
jgi:hypothetical protein